MGQIIPRKNESEIEEILAGAVPVGRFYEDVCPDTGGLNAVYSRSDRGRLYQIKFNDPASKGFLRMPRASAKVQNINPEPYKIFTLEFKNEYDLRDSSLVDFLDKLPSDERQKFVAFEVAHIRNDINKTLAEIRLYKRI